MRLDCAFKVVRGSVTRLSVTIVSVSEGLVIVALCTDVREGPLKPRARQEEAGLCWHTIEIPRGFEGVEEEALL